MNKWPVLGGATASLNVCFWILPDDYLAARTDLVAELSRRHAELVLSLGHGADALGELVSKR